MLHHLDVRPLPGADETGESPSPVLIIGPPRSGSTLLYQLIANAFEFSFFSNLHHLFYGSPTTCEKFFGVHRRRRNVGYESSYGQTSGLLAPSECGEYWYRFFPRDPAYQDPREASPEKIEWLRASLSRFVLASGKPVLIKNLFCTLRIPQILAAFPRACFITVGRDTYANAVSILEGRLMFLGAYERWLGVPPKNIDQLRDKPPAEQVVGQIRAIENMIRQAPIPSDQITAVKYEEVCRSPQAVIDGLASFFQERRIQVNRREVALPQQFSVNEKVVADRELDMQLRAVLELSPNRTENVDQ